MTELKPCPFCGREAEIQEEYDDYYGISYAIFCTECDCIFDIPDNRNEENLIKAWNRRAGD